MQIIVEFGRLVEFVYMADLAVVYLGLVKLANYCTACSELPIVNMRTSPWYIVFRLFSRLTDI
jgi:hypothetical protein